MPLDPQVKAHYAAKSAVAASSAPPGAPFSFEALRKGADALYNDADPHPAVHSVIDREIPCADRSIPVRIYSPGNEGPYPVLLYFHGGGFCIHNIASHDSLCRRLCNTGSCVVVNVGYRLAP